MINKKGPLSVLLALSMGGCVSASIKGPAAPAPKSAAATSSSTKSCTTDSGTQNERSKELQKIVEEDQAPRKRPYDKIDWVKTAREDELRMKRVAEIFAEGCLKTAKDYSAAALIFQHGKVPDHFYQTYIWSKRAVELGDDSQKQMIANAIDRYLINRGYKQIFAAQTHINPDQCHCIDQTETAFADNIRMIYTGLTIKDRIEIVKKINSQNPKCAPSLTFCEAALMTPPKGLFPGIW